MKQNTKLLFLGLALLAGAAEAATATFTANGNWTAPAGVTSATVEAWGGGGAGGGATGNPAKGGGGAGGQYANRVVTVVPGNIYAVVVGVGGAGGTGDGAAGGDSTFAGISVVARGGAGGTGAINGVAGVGSAVGGVGDLVYAGGSGSDGSVGGACNNGGAGGGGAGSTGAGGNAAGNTAGTGTATGGGDGGAGRNNSGNGNAGNIAGGGGGGACAENNTDRNGGAGARGQVTITYASVPTVTTDAATTITTTGALLNATVNDNLADTAVTFQYGLTVAYGSTVTASVSPLLAGSGATGMSATVSGLQCNTTYHFRGVGVNVIGTTNGGDLTFTTLACPTGASVTASPGACVDVAGIGSRIWTTLDADVSDNTYATTTLGDNQQSHYLECTGYGFAIPAGATINGITVNVERSATGANSPIRDLAMRIVRAGAIGATDRSTATTWPITDTVEAHGGAADLWGLGWTAADINSANFGAALAAYKNGTNGGTFTVNVDHMPITVNYTPATPWVASIDRVSSNPTAANTSVSWDVLFSGNATGVDASDFQLAMGGSATGATITGVTGSGRVWTVTANTGTGATGTLGLNLVDNDTIIIGGVALGGAGANNGNFTGQVYTIEVPVCSGTYIFCDDFERANPGAVGNGWTITPGPAADCAGVAGNTGCAGIDTDIPPFNATTNRANPTRSMFTRWSIVSVDSRTIDLSSYPSALLSFWMRRGGDSFSEYPEAAGEDYLVQYFANDGTWKVLAQYPTGVMQGQVFTPVIQLPANAMHANFKLRYYQPAGSGDANGGTGGGAAGVVGYDYWHIDDVIIRDAPESSYVGAFCDNFEAGLGRWSISAEGAPGLPPAVNIGDAGLNTTDFLSATHELDMRWGYVVASTLRTDMTGVNGNITYWIKSGTTAVRDPDANEDLLVEYRNSAGTWTTLATYLGADVAGTIYNGSHVIPADAQHTGFRLRFRMLNGSAFDNDYWHVDDVCVGASLTNVDLAIAKSHTGSIIPGANATYTLTVSNPGMSALAGTISVVDTLPAGMSYQSASGTNWTCSANGQDVTCSYVGTLNGGATAPAITLIAAVDAGASGTLTNTATVSGSAPDSNSANNTATDTVILRPGFAFTDGPCVHGLAFGDPSQTCSLINWSPQIAGQNFANVYITRVNTLQRPSRYVVDTTVNLEFGLSCHNPANNAGVSATFSAAGSALPVCTSNGAAPTAWSTGGNVTFLANTTSVGPFAFNYADVGLVELHVRNSADTTQTGTSGQFVVRPAGFVLSAIRRTSDNFANPAAADATGAAFVKAGEAFSVTVRAVNSLGNTTPNYGNETTAESVQLTQSLAAGLGLTQNPALSGTFGNFGLDCAGGAGTAGVACGTTFTWGEVGIITLTPSVGDGDYLGAGNVTGTASGNVGRFYPDHFDTVVTTAPMTCGALTFATACPGGGWLAYSGQAFTVEVTARNLAGGVTQNYTYSATPANNFARDVTLSAVDSIGGAANGAGAISAGTPMASTVFAAGVGTLGTPVFTFTTTPTVPTDVFVRATDGETTSLRTVATDSVEGGLKVVSGRLKVSNAYGSEQLPLPVTATVQYYSAAGAWPICSADSVTSFNTGTNLVVNIVKNPLTAANVTVLNAGAVTVANGVRAFTLNRPGVNGSADVSLSSPAYLLSVAGRVTFGVYKGANQFIYMRETY
ncbi:MAG: DUF11 domain-containing protein [Nitrosomonadales bacterium]|nr:DUF11 domain-containing protein [Nitrosomonadales bacterium]